MSSTTDLMHKSVLDRFKSELSQGRLLTYKELADFARDNQLTVSAKYLRHLRQKVLATAVHKPLKRPAHWMTIQHPQLGLFSSDYAEYQKKWKRWNGGNVGFIVLVNNATGLWSIKPVKGKDGRTYRAAIKAFARESDLVSLHTILTDREPAIWKSPESFQADMKREYGIDFQFLRRWHKAFAAERAVRDIKYKLSMSLLERGGQKWVGLLPEIERRHNAELVPGTEFRRNQINDSNWMKFLDQLYESKDATLMFNSRSVDYQSIASTRWKRLLFRFAPGQKVLASRSGVHQKGQFDKNTVLGTYAKKPVYEIAQAKLASTKDGDYVPGNVCGYGKAGQKSLSSPPTQRTLFFVLQCTKSRRQARRSQNTAGTTNQSSSSFPPTTRTKSDRTCCSSGVTLGNTLPIVSSTMKTPSPIRAFRTNWLCTPCPAWKRMRLKRSTSSL
jgi:hypothetical protein